MALGRYTPENQRLEPKNHPIFQKENRFDLKPPITLGSKLPMTLGSKPPMTLGSKPPMTLGSKPPMTLGSKPPMTLGVGAS